MYYELLPHLFRTEAGKITAVLCKYFSFEHMEAAEDITSETFLSALETWPYKGIPPNTTAWLHAVAKNKARNFLIRQKKFDRVVGEIAPDLHVNEIDLSEENIFDSQLQMLFAICHPMLPPEAQVGLALRILCGFGIDEIASAFLCNKEVINKRLFRAREKLRQEKISVTFPHESVLTERLDNVLATLYLLFSEGYYSETQDQVIREDLCEEAIRLTTLLISHPSTSSAKAHALLALMLFHASRLPARKDEYGHLVLYDDQDESRWNKQYIERGTLHLKNASTGDTYSKYHLEAAIAYWHTIKEDSKEKWENILQLYNHLLQLEYSPIAALNRTYALSKANSVAEAIAEAEKLELNDNPYYFALLGELYSGMNEMRSQENFKRALGLAKTKKDKEVIGRKLKLKA